MTNEEWLENLEWKKLLRFLQEWDNLKASEQLDWILDLLKESYEDKNREKAASCLIPLAIVRNRVVKLEEIAEEKEGCSQS